MRIRARPAGQRPRPLPLQDGVVWCAGSTLQTPCAALPGIASRPIGITGASIYKGRPTGPEPAGLMMVKCCQRSVPTVMLRPITWPIFAVFAITFAQAGSFAIASCALPCASQLG